MSEARTLAAESGAGRSFARIPLIVAAAFFMETLDASIIVTALPSIARSFHEATLSLSIGISAYLVAVAVLVPTAGWMSERFGARNVFAGAVLTFTLASLLCGLSPTFWTFVASRVLQGGAAAFMSPVGRLVVLRETPKHRLIESLGMIVWPALIGPVLGPPLGGLITTYASWRWIFFLNLPIGIVGFWLVQRYIPKHAAQVRARFDVRGFAYTASALVALIQGLSFIGESAETRLAGTVLACAGIVAGVLAVRHARRHDAPLLDLRVLKDKMFVMSTVSAGLVARSAIQASPFILPLMFQIGFGYSAFKSGLMLLIFMGGNLVMKVATTRLLKRLGFRTVLVVNGLAGAAAICACALMTPDWSVAAMCLALILAGMTRSMQFTALNTMAFADIQADSRAGATTLAAVSQQIGAALGVAFAALGLSIGRSVDGNAQLALADFRFALLLSAVLLAAAAVWFLRLHVNAGAEVTGAAMSRAGE